MKHTQRVVQWLAIVMLTILVCMTYGVLHDQVTARICVEYFTIGHRPIGTDDPTLLGFFWGIAATWWVGLILGIVLATAAIIGPNPVRTMRSLYLPLLAVSAGTALFAGAAGLVGFVTASVGWIHLTGPLAVDIPAERHSLFLADLWTHSASYAGGFTGGLLLVRSVWRSRRPGNVEPSAT